MQGKQDKIDETYFKDHRNNIAGLAMPAGDLPGFVCVFGVTIEPVSRFVLAADDESDDVGELIEKLKAMTKWFRWQQGKYTQHGDFVFGDVKDRTLYALLHKHNIKLNSSGVELLKDKEKPLMTLASRISQAQKDGVIVISDELKLSLRLRDDVLPKPAALKFGDSPGFESLCYAYEGWQELIKKSEQPATQEDVESDYIRY